MGHVVDFKDVSTTGLESSKVAVALAGLRANEARYFWNKYKLLYETFPIQEKPEELAFVEACLAERDIVIAAKPLEIFIFENEELYWPEIYYESGLVVNVLYAKDKTKGKSAVGLKLAVGMEIPLELAEKFKFARQRSKLAGEIRGSFFVLKNEHTIPG